MANKSKGSMPKKPALAGTQWTKAHAKKIIGRWVRVGYLDAPSVLALVVCQSPPRMMAKWYDMIAWDPIRQEMIRIDGPDQIIDIGDALIVP